MRYLTNSSTDPYFNMAFDEYCLKELQFDEPVFYLWQNSPSVIMGANQEVNTEVNLEFLKENGIKLARRVTGGGTVFHDQGNLNYTIVGRSKDLERDYPAYNLHVLKALQLLGVDATLSGRNDILVKGKKVSGFAKRVCKTRLMVHGTLMFNVNLDHLEQVLCPPVTKLQSKGIASVRSRVANLKDFLPSLPDITAFKQHLESIMSNNYADKEYILSPQELARIRQLAEEKFIRWEWIYGHSPRATLKNSARLPCGTIEANLSITENRITDCCFGGDFLGNLPTETLESSLKGIPYTYEDVYKCLSQQNIPLYFDGITVEELTNIIMCR